VVKYFCKPGKHYYYEDMEFWAQGGMVHVFDHRDGCPVKDQCKSVRPKEWERRAKQIGAVLAQDHQLLPQDRIAKENLCNNMVKCAEEAFFQGDPTDQEVQLWRLRHRPGGITRELAEMLAAPPAPPPLRGLPGVPSHHLRGGPPRRRR
jgi:hypothetical protein